MLKVEVFAQTYLSFPVDSYDTSGGLMRGGDKNGLPADPVHVDASSCLQVVQVDVAIFGDEEDYILLGADLKVKKQRLFVFWFSFFSFVVVSSIGNLRLIKKLSREEKTSSKVKVCCSSILKS